MWDLTNQQSQEVVKPAPSREEREPSFNNSPGQVNTINVEETNWTSNVEPNKELISNQKWTSPINSDPMLSETSVGVIQQQQQQQQVEVVEKWPAFGTQQKKWQQTPTQSETQPAQQVKSSTESWPTFNTEQSKLEKWPSAATQNEAPWTDYSTKTASNELQQHSPNTEWQGYVTASSGSSKAKEDAPDATEWTNSSASKWVSNNATDALPQPPENNNWGQTFEVKTAEKWPSPATEATNQPWTDQTASQESSKQWDSLASKPAGGGKWLETATEPSWSQTAAAAAAADKKNEWRAVELSNEYASLPKGPETSVPDVRSALEDVNARTNVATASEMVVVNPKDIVLTESPMEVDVNYRSSLMDLNAPLTGFKQATNPSTSGPRSTLNNASPLISTLNKSIQDQENLLVNPEAAAAAINPLAGSSGAFKGPAAQPPTTFQ